MSHTLYDPTEEHRKRSGYFVSPCLCASFATLAVVLAVLVGVAVYLITVSPASDLKQQEAKPLSSACIFETMEDEKSNTGPTPDIRLPTSVEPTFYRLKLKVDPESANFSGKVTITIQAKKPVREIILHSKELVLDEVILTEQIPQIIVAARHKRQINESVATTEANEKQNNETKTTTNTVDTTEHANPETTTAKTEATDVPNKANNSSVSGPDAQENRNITESPKDLTETKLPTTTEMSTIMLPITPQITNSQNKNIKIMSVKPSNDDKIIISLASSLRTDADYTLELTFRGNNSAVPYKGFYVSDYKDAQNKSRYFAGTQFKPIHARTAFPCFDEPGYKASFEISIAHKHHLHVQSNMPTSSQENVTDDLDYKWTHFEKSVLMPTYLVAFVVSDFKSLELTYIASDNFTKSMKIWTKPDFLSSANFSLHFTRRLLDYFENLFGVPYGVEKLDLVVIPGSKSNSSSAMGNWGLMILNENFLQSNTTVVSTMDSAEREAKISLLTSLAREIAHQWFGNLVTMEWWDEVWLNEGVSTYLAYASVDKLEPSLKVYDEFAATHLQHLTTPGIRTRTLTSHIVRSSDIDRSLEDDMSHHVVANLLRALNFTLSGKVFNSGLVRYLKNWSHLSASQENLFKSIDEAARTNNISISAFNIMQTWIENRGFPVVNVSRNYATGEVTFTQNHFSNAKVEDSSLRDQVWHISLSFISLDSHDWEDAQTLVLKDRSVTIKTNLTGSEALLVNGNNLGYYIINYDEINWDMIIEAVRNDKVKPLTARLTLLSSAFTLAKATKLSYGTALNVTFELTKTQLPQNAMHQILHEMIKLSGNLRKSSAFMDFSEYIQALLEKPLVSINFGQNNPKDAVEAEYAKELVSLECEAEAPRCLKWAKEQFEKWADNSSYEIPKHLEETVFKTAVKYGGRREFQLIWKSTIGLYRNNTMKNKQMLEALTNTREDYLLMTLLERSLQHIDTDYPVWENIKGSAGTTSAQEYISKHWFDIMSSVNKANSSQVLEVFLKGAFGDIYTSNDLEKFELFCQNHKGDLMQVRDGVKSVYKSAKEQVEWLPTYEHQISTWLRNFVLGRETKSDVPIKEIKQEEEQDSNADKQNITMPGVTEKSNSTQLPATTSSPAS